MWTNRDKPSEDIISMSEVSGGPSKSFLPFHGILSLGTQRHITVCRFVGVPFFARRHTNTKKVPDRFH